VNVIHSDSFQSSLWGLARGVGVQVMVFPIEAVKVRLQTEVKPAIPKIWELYRGFLPQAMKIALKQMWCWPMITQLPQYFNKRGVPVYAGEFLTGIAIASLDALLTTPLEKLKISRITSGQTHQLLKDGWQGTSYHFAKHAVSWPTFLVAQKYFREENENPTLAGLAFVGVKVALTVSLISAPFDWANSIAMSGKTVCWKGLPFSMRGWSLSALCLMIHNISSIILIEKLEKK
jgi:hypothetical protein